MTSIQFADEARPGLAPIPAVPSAIEFATVGLAVVIYGGWLLLTAFHNRIPWPVLVILGGWVTAWHNSLQHEVIHGHPTPWRWVNTLVAAPPLSLWLPFEAYRHSHLQHHATHSLTDPSHDPESRYLHGVGGAVRRGLAHLQSTLAGRLTIGVIAEVAGFWAGQARAFARNAPGVRRAWLIHLLSLAPVLLWLRFVCDLSLARYVLCFVLPGAALSLLRSFAEHRADAVPSRRVAAVERAPVLGLLFLSNNLHVAHHRWPGAPWYRLGHLYARHRETLLVANGGLVYRGYADVARRFLFSPHDRIDFAPAMAQECHGS